MQRKRFPVPEPGGYDQAYELSYKLACERLSKIDIQEQCRRSGAEYRVVDGRASFIIQYLSRPYQVSLPDGTVSVVGSAETVPIRDKLLILHYFNTARGIPLTGKLVNFRELPDGTVYYPTFQKRTIKPVVDNFGKDPALLLEVSQKLGARKIDFGDVGIVVNGFPRVPVTIVLWRGDEEFPPQGNLLLDTSVTDYLPTEDIIVLCETIAWRLVRSKR